MIPEHTEIVTELLVIAQEEWTISIKCTKSLKKRLYFRKNQKDDYVNQLFKFIIQGSREDLIIDKMLFAAMIEARSCERFKVLTENIKDEELKRIYKELMISEANHLHYFHRFHRTN